MTAPAVLFLVALVYGPVLRWAVVQRRREQAYVDPATVAWLGSLAAVEDDPITVAQLEAWRAAQARLACGKTARIDIVYPSTVLECAS